MKINDITRVMIKMDGRCQSVMKMNDNDACIVIKRRYKRDGWWNTHTHTGEGSIFL